MNRGPWLACSLRWAPLRRRPAVTWARNRPLPPTSNRPRPPARRRRRDGLSRDPTPRPDPGVPTPRAGLRVQLDRRLLGLDRRWSGAGTRATGRPRTRPTSSSARASCSSTGGRSTTGPTGRALAATGPTATVPWPGARGRVARAPLGGARRLAGGAQRGVAPHPRRGGGPSAVGRREGLSRCAAATRDSARPRRRRGDRRPAFTPRPRRPFTPRPRPPRRPHAAAVAAAACTTSRRRLERGDARARECTATNPRP